MDRMPKWRLTRNGHQVAFGASSKAQQQRSRCGHVNREATGQDGDCDGGSGEYRRGAEKAINKVTVHDPSHNDRYAEERSSKSRRGSGHGKISYVD